MIHRITIRVLGALAVAMLLAAPAAANECGAAKVRQTLKGREVPQAEIAQAQRICREGARAEAAAKAKRRDSGQVAGGGSGRGVAPGSGALAAPEQKQEIWCGHNNCTCWNGNIINGCGLAATVCEDELICVGPICSCTPKNPSR